VKYIIGTGGVLVHSKDPEEILKAGCWKEEDINSLKPKNPKFVIDKQYILSAMGLLAEEEPDMAVRMMKKYILETGE
ncbi:MAG: glutamate mutase L, partial [Clostridiaceae bacterium]